MSRAIRRGGEMAETTDKKPPMNVSPPPSPSGAQLPPGVNPRDVKDPATRSAYVALIEKNRQRLARYGADARLFEAHAALLERAVPSVRDAQATLGLPTAEIVAMVQAADIAPADRAALLAGIK